MNQLDLFDELTYIDDDLILEAHEMPAKRQHLQLGGLRRIAMLAAAVMLLVVTTVATGGDFGIPRPKGWVSGNASTVCDIDYENQAIIVHDEGVYAIEKFGPPTVPAVSVTTAHAAEMRTETECMGQQIQIIQEAMILMPDGVCQYKAQITEGTDTVVAVMDNIINGVAGEIANIRYTVSVLVTEEHDSYWRQTTPGPDGMVWSLLQNWNAFLPSQLNYDFPLGVDARFPDMKYNYDGRNSALE